MAEFTVLKNAGALDETVSAYAYRITEGGALVLYNIEPGGALPGQRTHDGLVRAFAPGRWLEVTRVAQAD